MRSVHQQSEDARVKGSLLAVSLVPALAFGTAARADDRSLCGQPGLDLVCQTVGAGFHMVPQKPASLRTFFLTMKPLPASSTPPFNVVFGGSGYTSVWGAD